MLGTIVANMTVNEIISIVTLIVGFSVSYGVLNHRIKSIEARNAQADKVMSNLKESLTKDLAERHFTLEARMSVGEQQSQRQEVFMTRIDERLVAVQATLEDIRRSGLK